MPKRNCLLELFFYTQFSQQPNENLSSQSHNSNSTTMIK
jgi:hypothetical protein